jgi:hypothetical protein
MDSIFDSKFLIFALIIFIILFVIFLILYLKQRKNINFKSYSHKKTSVFKIMCRKNMFWFILVCMAIVFSVYMLYSFELIEHASFLGQSKFDLIIAVGFFIGIIAAIWAIWARIDADKAFRQSLKTYNAIANTFDFVTFLDNEKLPQITSSIGKSGCNVELYLGFPCVGFFFSKRHKFKNDPINLFIDLKNVLKGIKDKLEFNKNKPEYQKIVMDYSLKIGCFDKSYSMKLLENHTMDKEQKQNFITHINEFYEYFEYFLDCSVQNFKSIVIPNDEKFRFISFESEDEGEKKGFIWIVPDLKVGTEETSEFDSMVFQTSEEKFIKLLKEVFLPQ